jgi:hypothetical protein
LQTLARFSTVVLWTQFMVARRDAVDGLLWTQDHVDQGFAWCDGMVLFAIPDHDGHVDVEVLRNWASPSLETRCLRAIEVPFVSDGYGVVCGNIVAEDIEFLLPAGSYALRFELLKTVEGGFRPPAFQGHLAGLAEESEDLPPSAFLVRIGFVPCENPDFRILRRHSEMVARDVLRRDAEPG